MATTDPVDVILRLVDTDFKRQLKSVEAQLEKLDSKQLRIPLDILAEKEIAKTEAQLQALDRGDITKRVDVDARGDGGFLDSIRESLDRAEDLVEGFFHRFEADDLFGSKQVDFDLFVSTENVDGLEFKPTVLDDALDAFDERIVESSVEIDPSFEVPKVDAIEEYAEETKRIIDDLDKFLERTKDPRFPRGFDVDIDSPFDSFDSDRREQDPRVRLGQFGRPELPGKGKGSGLDPLFEVAGGIFDTVSEAAGGLFNVAGAPDGGGGGGGGEGIGKLAEISKKLKKAVPSIRTWYNLIALVIPILITLTAGALGAAAAVGSLGAAFLAVGGLGALGFAADADSSLKELQRRLAETKESLIDTFRPASLSFAPIVDNLLRDIREVADELVQPLMGFAGFADVFSMGIRGGVAWVRQLIETINELQAPIQAIGVELGRAFGQYFIDLLRWAVEELANNYDAYVDLVDILAHLIGILFSVSKFAALVASTFEPVLAVVEALAAVLQNKLVIAIFAFLAPLALVVALLASLSYIITTIGFGAIIAGISGAAVAVWNLVAALATANALTAGLTLGLSLIGVGAGLLAVKEILDDHDGIGGNGQPGLGGGSTIPAPGSGTGRSRGGGGDTFNLNIYGSPDRHGTNRLISAIDSRIDRKTTISRNTARSP